MSTLPPYCLANVEPKSLAMGTDPSFSSGSSNLVIFVQLGSFGLLSTTKGNHVVQVALGRLEVDVFVPGDALLADDVARMLGGDVLPIVCHCCQVVGIVYPNCFIKGTSPRARRSPGHCAGIRASCPSCTRAIHT